MKTREAKLKIINKAVCEVVPDIKELKFGCMLSNGEMVLREGGDFGNEILQVIDPETGESGGHFADYVTREDGELTLETVTEYLENSGIEIIGRSIQIADILRSSRNLLVIRGNGQLVYEGYFKSEKHGDFPGDDHFSTWDLSLPLDGQSEGTIDLLYKVFDK